MGGTRPVILGFPLSESLDICKVYRSLGLDTCRGRAGGGCAMCDIRVFRYFEFKGSALWVCHKELGFSGFWVM